MRMPPEPASARDVLPTTYAGSGVNIAAGEQAMHMMRAAIEPYSGQRIANRFGAFGAAIESPGEQMLLVSSADGVGSKSCLARTDQEMAALGRDLVHHCINDILTCGARPLFFLDYLAFHHLEPVRAAAIVKAMATSCAVHGCALVGGETAELPDLYREGASEIAGFIVGSVPADRLLDGSTVSDGDALIGIASAGLHTNGFTLARRLLADRLDEPYGDEQHATVRTGLLAEHRCYLPAITSLLDQRLIHGLAHITGGGLPGNVPRMLPDGLAARINPASWPRPRIFEVISGYDLTSEELYRTFNMGLGMVMACAENEAGGILATLPQAWRIGRVEAQTNSERVHGLW